MIMQPEDEISEHVKVSLRVYLLRLIDEHDRLYSERFAASQQAIKDALAAQKELTNAAFSASEKAIVKAEEAQKAYNSAHNDLVHKMDAQYAIMMPQNEARSMFRGIEEKIENSRINTAHTVTNIEKSIADLRESRSVREGKSGGLNMGWIYLLGIVSLLGGLGGIIAVIVEVISRKP
jgi:hypothetical protein